MLIPPESKQTPLPTIARCRSSESRSPFPAGAHHDHPRRVVAAAADGHEHAHPELGRPVRLDHVDPQSVLLGDRPGLVGHDHRAQVVGRPVGERPGEVRALGHDQPTVRRRGQCRAITVRGDDDQLVEDRRRGLDVVEIDRARVVAALECAAGDHLGGGRSVAIERVGQRRDPDGQPTDDATGQPSLHGGGDPHDRFTVHGLGLAEADGQQPVRGDLPGRGHGGGEPLAADLPERDEGLDLAAGAPVEFAQGTIERGFPGHGDDEDIRGHIPRLIGDDADLHGIESSGSASPGFAGHAATAG